MWLHSNGEHFTVVFLGITPVYQALQIFPERMCLTTADQGHGVFLMLTYELPEYDGFVEPRACQHDTALTRDIQ